MAQTFYAQSDAPSPTMTVGDLIERLRQFDQNAPIVFCSPIYGCFGSNTAYSVENVEAVTLERREVTSPAHMAIDEETGEEYGVGEDTQVWHEWSGVVIT